MGKGNLSQPCCWGGGVCDLLGPVLWVFVHGCISSRDVAGRDEGGEGSITLPSHSLSGNSIGPAGGVPLAKSLIHCRCLEEIM